MPHGVSPGKGRDSGKLIAVRPVNLKQPGTGKKTHLNWPTSTKLNKHLIKNVIVGMNKQTHTQENAKAANKSRMKQEKK